MLKRTLLTALALAFAPAAFADLTSDIQNLQHRWEITKYQTPEKEQENAYSQLAANAKQVVDANPGKAEALIWKGIILASYAGAKGGLGALSIVEEAKNSLEQATNIDGKALNGSAYTTLGSIYYQVPGWPVGFGDDDKARDYLKKGLEVNPDGLDSNFWYASFLIDQRDYQEALPYLEKAKAAAPRPGREIADAGRQKEVDELLAKVHKKLKK